MMNDVVAILDTGSGNLRSVEKALAKMGGKPVITNSPDIIRHAGRLVVPGQGAFGGFVRSVKDQGLEQLLRDFIASGRPFLGICLGLQILYEESEENGPTPGLGVLGGQVVKFRPTVPNYKVPHMGWNQVWRPGRGDAPDDPLLKGIPDGSYFYFVHSYYVVPEDVSTVALRCEYATPFVAAIRKDNIFACQFHPEKSQQAGLLMLKQFLEAP